MKLPTLSTFAGSLPMLVIHTIIIAFVGFMEAIAIAKQLYIKKPPKDQNGVELFKNPTPVDSNQELFGQGLANITSSISGSIPVSGSFSRSAVNESSGAYSGLSSIVTMIVVGLTLLFATPLLHNLPEATLGVIVIFAVIPLIKVKEINKLYKEDGFILVDANSRKYIIGNPKKKKPITLKLLDKKLHYKLLIYPDLYFGEAYTDGKIKIENGSLTDFLELAMKNIGRNEINVFGKILKKVRGTYRHLTNFNFAKKS